MDSALAKQTYNSGKAVVIYKLVELSAEPEALKRIIMAQEHRIQQIENQLVKDSHHSNKPPSRDGFKKQPRTKNQRNQAHRNLWGNRVIKVIHWRW